MHPVTIACIVASVISVILEFVFVGGHGHAPYDIHTPGFHLAYGFGGCVVIVLVSKYLGKVFLQKSEDFYGAAASAEGDGR